MMTTTVRSNSPFLSTFPGRYYYDPAIFQEEQEHIFGKMWFYVGRADALSSPGSYRVVTVSSESIIVMKD
jgi:glycine betaine catabolism A